jgi:hypothetical protein
MIDSTPLKVLLRPVGGKVGYNTIDGWTYENREAVKNVEAGTSHKVGI